MSTGPDETSVCRILQSRLNDLSAENERLLRTIRRHLDRINAINSRLGAIEAEIVEIEGQKIATNRCIAQVNIRISDLESNRIPPAEQRRDTDQAALELCLRQGGDPGTGECIRQENFLTESRQRLAELMNELSQEKELRGELAVKLQTIEGRKNDLVEEQTRITTERTSIEVSNITLRNDTERVQEQMRFVRDLMVTLGCPM